MVAIPTFDSTLNTADIASELTGKYVVSPIAQLGLAGLALRRQCRFRS